MGTTNRHQDARAKAELEINLLTQTANFHPLEAFHYFRKWPRSFVRNFVYTLILNLMFALFFSSLAFVFGTPSKLLPVIDEILKQNLIIANVVGFAFWGVFEAIAPVLRWVNRRPAIVIGTFYAVVGMIIVTASFYAVSFLPGNAGMRVWVGTPNQLITGFVISAIISTILTVVWRRRIEELATQIALTEERERAESAERAATQANLRALQAQIEPHFLFNTLANVTSLIHSQPDQAKLMLENFISYLRASLTTSRESETTLGQEFELMRRFLSILQIRMGERLQVDVAISSELGAHHLPPMLIQPLVENAIKHGLEPKVEGGAISLTASRVNDALRIEVADTGLGFQNTTSGGIGLLNVRERLATLYGDQGGLSIEDNVPSGARVVLTLPLTDIDASVAKSNVQAVLRAKMAQVTLGC